LRYQVGADGEKILFVFEYLKQLEEAKQQQTIQEQRKRIGFKPANDES